ncbi:MAG: efflux RND transporter periplasmic adaptor subunit [Planctomycetota bacterium]
MRYPDWPLVVAECSVKKKLLFVPVLALGILGFWLLARSAREPERVPEREAARRVRVVAAPKLDVIPRAVGFGVVRPGRVWHAVPEVGGRVVEMEARLREGNILKAGTVLVRIDRADYDLEVAQAQAQIQSIDAQIEQLDAKKETLEASLEIEKKSLALAQADRERMRKLVAKESMPAANLDEEERKVLTQTARVQDIKNSLTMIEPDKKVLKARRVLEDARLAKARLNVERTVIRAPFDCRIGPVDLERDQVVQTGQELFFADSIGTSEVTGQFPMVGIAQVFPAAEAPIDATAGGIELLMNMGLTAKVRLRAGPLPVEWDAKVTRVEGVDPETRTVGVVVSVEGSYKKVRPGTQPPLVRGMYVEAVLRGPARTGVVVVPRSALHAGRVYLVDDDNRLEIRAVEVAFVQSSFAALRAGLAGGERVVLSDLFPALEGMLLDAEADERAAKKLEADATGATRVR